jgi:hypothetical protein
MRIHASKVFPLPVQDIFGLYSLLLHYFFYVPRILFGHSYYSWCLNESFQFVVKIKSLPKYYS